MNAVNFEAMTDAEFIAYGKSVHHDYFTSFNIVTENIAEHDMRYKRIEEQRRRVREVQSEAGRRMNVEKEEVNP